MSDAALSKADDDEKGESKDTSDGEGKVEGASVGSKGKEKETDAPDAPPVEVIDVDELDTREVTERLDDAVVLVVNDEGTTALAVTAVPELALTGAELARVGNLNDVGVRLKGLEEGNSLLGLLERLGSGANNERNFLDLLNAVTTSENEGRESISGKGRDNGETALVLVHLDVPLAPDLGGGEHATTTAHVTEGSL